MSATGKATAEVITAAVTAALAPLRQEIGKLSAEMSDLRLFVDGRMKEIRTDIDATAKLVEWGEEAITGSLGEVQEKLVHLQEVRAQLAAVNHVVSGLSPANTGFELESVLEVTESSAGRIMDAAERIARRVGEAAARTEDAAVRSLQQDLQSEIREIFEACSFQDLTGQRVRKAVEHLTRVEQTLHRALAALGLEDAEAERRVDAYVASAAVGGMSQDDIDSMF